MVKFYPYYLKQHWSYKTLHCTIKITVEHQENEDTFFVITPRSTVAWNGSICSGYMFLVRCFLENYSFDWAVDKNLKEQLQEYVNKKHTMNEIS